MLVLVRNNNNGSRLIKVDRINGIYFWGGFNYEETFTERRAVLN